MNNNSVYNDYYKAIKREESSVVLNHYHQNTAEIDSHSKRNNSLPTAPKIAEDEDLQYIPTTSQACLNHVPQNRPRTLETGQPVLTVTTPNGEQHFVRQQIPVKKSSIEVVLNTPGSGNDRRPTINSFNSYSSQYYTRVIQQQSDAEEKYYYNQFERQYEQCNTPAEIQKSLRWIHWRMTLFVFYWIVWFIGLILVIIIVAYRAKSV